MHAERVSEFYRERRDVFQTAMVKYLDGCAEWVRPEAGLFFWCVIGFFSGPFGLLCDDKSHIYIGLSSICPLKTTSMLVTRNLPFGPLHLRRGSLRFLARCSYRMGTRRRMSVLLLV